MEMADITPLINNDGEYRQLADSLSERFNCEWDDVVHDSYERYVKDMGANSEKLHTIRCRAEALAKEVESVNIDELVRESECLCREADEV